MLHHWAERNKQFLLTALGDPFLGERYTMLRSPYVVAIPYVVCPSVCPSVTFLRLTLRIEIFGNVFAPSNRSET